MQVPRLSEISLNEIVSNFGTLNAEFQNPNSSVPWKHREFLKRHFSEIIFRRLKREWKLKAEYLDVLINPHLKELDIRGMDKSLLPYVIHKLQTHGKNVLSFKASPRDLKENSREPRYSPVLEDEILTSEAIYLPPVEEEDLCERLMSSLPNVERIDFDDTPPHEMYEAISNNCSHLKVMLLPSTLSRSKEVECNGICYVIKRCPHLETLRHPDSIGVLYSMYNRDFLFLTNGLSNTSKDPDKYVLKNLCSQGRGYPLHVALEICAVICPYVTHLQFDNLMGNEELEKIVRFSLLEDIRIKHISGSSMSSFNQFLKLHGSKLTAIEIPYTPLLSVVTLTESCPQLRSLKLEDNYAEGSDEDIDESLQCGTSLLNLKSLEFSFGLLTTQMTLGNLKLLLSAAKKLRKLSLHHSRSLTNGTIKNLDLYHLYELDVHSTDIRVESLMDLLLRGNLQTLNVEHCKNITHNDFICLTKCLSDNQRDITHIKWKPRRGFH